MDTTLFQYCQKIVIFNESENAILLVKRRGEADFDGTFSFIGGKMEVTDGSFIEGLRREKNEEIGEAVQLDIFPFASYNELYVKKSGQAMVLPHFYAIYKGGEIHLNPNEYSEYQWVELSDLDNFEPKIDSVLPMVKNMLNIKKIANISQFVPI
jgi:8-oxo-dGTP pyrophosphatase MutT (NUDIX family)